MVRLLTNSILRIALTVVKRLIGMNCMLKMTFLFRLKNAMFILGLSLDRLY